MKIFLSFAHLHFGDFGPFDPTRLTTYSEQSYHLKSTSRIIDAEFQSWGEYKKPYGPESQAKPKLNF